MPGSSFCKVCFDAGKTEEEYTSHYVRDQPGPQGVVVCPHLLSISCRYCKNKGHTPKGCPVLKAKNENEEETTKPYHPKRYNVEDADGWTTTVKSARKPRIVIESDVAEQMKTKTKNQPNTKGNCYELLEEFPQPSPIVAEKPVEKEKPQLKTVPVVSAVEHLKGAWANKPVEEPKFLTGTRSVDSLFKSIQRLDENSRKQLFEQLGNEYPTSALGGNHDAPKHNFAPPPPKWNLKADFGKGGINWADDDEDFN
jgi:hypothetical protein